MRYRKRVLLRHKLLAAFGFALLLCMISLGSCARGPYHNYTLDLTLPPPESKIEPGVLQVGVAMRDISPDFGSYDAWTDVNGNGKFERGVDTWEDRNGNGKFDGIWIAGFNTNRPATGQNDPAWTRAIALRNNGVTLVLVTIDSIGIFHNEFIRIRKMLDPALGVDHVLFSSTHCHELPDTMKIWSGANHWFGVDVPVFGYKMDYLELIQERTKEAIEEAVSKLAPADMYCVQVEIEPEGFVNDSRKPVIFDKRMSLMRFTAEGTDDTIATVVNWGNHPETLGGRNTILTSDFPHFLREGVENGVPEPNGAAGFGGMCLYFQGQIGGLMTQLHTEVPHRDGQRKFKEASFEKAEALGQNLAIVACNALRSDRVWKNETPVVAAAAKTFLAPMQGLYKWAILLGLIHEGYYWGSKAKTEVNALRVGDVVILGVPGEIYPEIVEGGIEALPGNDFDLREAAEHPPLRGFIEEHAKMGFVIGLANDEIGYILPKSQWDTKAPFVYDGKDQYGEENSPGPEVAAVLHAESRDVLERVNRTFK